MLMYHHSWLLVVLTTLTIGCAAADFDLLLLHNNDMHARFEETERNSGTCRQAHRNVSCVGGFARVAHEVRRYRQMALDGHGREVLFLNAGDTYVGTVWFTLFTWNISYQFINMLQPDAMSLGNHEFDNTVAGLVPFVNNVKSPIVAANLDLSRTTSLNKITKSVIIEKGGRLIGVIGYLTNETKLISSPGSVIFLDEVASIKEESELLDRQGVKIIIALGHSGYLMDQKIAAEVPLVDVVVGGHTNTFLWNGPKPDAEEIEDLYPKVVTQKSGKKVPVVQAYAYTKYLGRLNLTFNDNGDLIRFAGQPQLLGPEIPQELDVLALLETFRPAVIEINKEIVGQSRVTLDGDSKKCRYQECNFGNLIADSLVAYKASISASLWTIAPIGLMNGGGIRNSIEPNNGDVTRGDLLGVLPFGNNIITLTLNGSDLIKTLEIGARSNGETSSGEFLQVSGLRVVYDMSQPAYSRVVSVKARCGPCKIPLYEDVVPDRDYTVITTSFLASQGGDNHHILMNNGRNKVIEDLSDVDVLVWYFKHYSPIFPEVEGRISFVDKAPSSSIRLATCNILIVVSLVSVINKNIFM